MINYHIRHYRAHVYLVQFLFFSFMLLPFGEIKMNINVVFSEIFLFPGERWDSCLCEADYVSLRAMQ